MLQELERTDLIVAVADQITISFTRLKTIVPPEHLRRIQTDAIPEEYAGHVIRYCERSGWIESPALIIKLLEAFQYMPLFAAAIKRLRATPPPILHFPDNRPWDALLVALELPFLNRKKTRRAIELFSFHLQSAINPPGARVLIVNGPASSGKSFTYHYILYVNSILQNLNFRIAWVDYKKQINNRFGPEELIRALIDQVEPDWDRTLPELDAQQPARWLLELTQRLTEAVIKNGTTWFIVLDNFDAPTVPRETLDLIQRIAAAATGEDPLGGADDSLRLVLLGFNELIANFKNRVVTDKIGPVSRDDVKNYLVDYARYRRKENEVDPADFEKMVDSILTADIDDHTNRTQLIAQRSIRIATAIFA